VSYKLVLPVSCQGAIDSYIEISGRSKCGKAYTDDEVVVEIIGQEIESERFSLRTK
jgi:hypothetical protein